jgi:restriction system protein
LEVVSLDDMDWFEFEQFVAFLFEKLGMGKAEEILKGNDAGRDITLRSPEGLTIVECKHHPEGSIGRPVVQKLHSAVISARAKKGFLVTTGHFAENATVYTRSLGSIIELVDSRILSDMANKAGIRLLKKGEKTTVFHVIPPPQGNLERKMIDYNFRSVISFPNAPEQLSKTECVETKFVPAYLMEYNLYQIFSTSVGVVHRIHVTSSRVLLNGENGSVLPPLLAQTVSPTVMIEDWHSIEAEKFTAG